MHRLFVAIRPPEDVRDRLVDTMEALPGARWQDDEQLHITLRFVGEVDTPLANDLAAALGKIEAEPFELVLDGVGHFETRNRPRAIWAQVAESEPLMLLQRKVERACRSVGLAPETRRYHPHVTIARVNRSTADIASWISEHGQLRTRPFCVDSFALFESELGSAGATYRAVARYQLG